MEKYGEHMALSLVNCSANDLFLCNWKLVSNVNVEMMFIWLWVSYQTPIETLKGLYYLPFMFGLEISIWLFDLSVGAPASSWNSWQKNQSSATGSL